MLDRIDLDSSSATVRTLAERHLGWFGPRGLASIVFAVILVAEANLPHEHLIVLAIYLTVGLSVFAHGLSAGAPGHPLRPLVRAAPARQGSADAERPDRGHARADPRRRP